MLWTRIHTNTNKMRANRVFFLLLFYCLCSVQRQYAFSLAYFLYLYRYMTNTYISILQCKWWECSAITVHVFMPVYASFALLDIFSFSTEFVFTFTCDPLEHESHRRDYQNAFNMSFSWFLILYFGIHMRILTGSVLSRNVGTYYSYEKAFQMQMGGGRESSAIMLCFPIREMLPITASLFWSNRHSNIWFSKKRFW